MPDHFSRTGDSTPGIPAAPLQGTDGGWWDEFFTDRSKPIPFFAEWPDENLAEWFGSGLLVPGRVLELGCGNGRNAAYLASLGCAVEAIDFSAQAIGWARQRADLSGVPVSFQHCSIFEAQLTAGSYDLVYDSALKSLSRRSTVPVHLDILLDRRLPDPVEIAAYYTVAEALTNAAKHASATAADIEVSTGDGVLRLRVHDNGHGGAAFTYGTGLVGLKDRAEALGGQLRLDSPPGAGTTLEITLPVGDPAEPQPPTLSRG